MTFLIPAFPGPFFPSPRQCHGIIKLNTFTKAHGGKTYLAPFGKAINRVVDVTVLGLAIAASGV